MSFEMGLEETKLQVLNDHYKDTFGILRDYLRFRDKLFTLILVVVALLLFQLHSPKDSGEIISQLISTKLSLTKIIDLSFVGSLLWFVLFSLVLRYYQTAVWIEKQYKYIHEIERDLCKYYGSDCMFLRESKTYFKNYPLFTTWAWVLYTIIFPCFLNVITFTKIYAEYRNKSIPAPFTYWVNLGIFFGILVSTISYLLVIHYKK